MKNHYSKHHPRDELRHQSRHDHHSKHKNTDKRKNKKHGRYKKTKSRAMVADASDVDMISNYTSSSSSREDKDHGQHKEKSHVNRNINEQCLHDGSLLEQQEEQEI
jgi:hypothetical protein